MGKEIENLGKEIENLGKVFRINLLPLRQNESYSTIRELWKPRISQIPRSEFALKHYLFIQLYFYQPKT